MSGRGVVLPRVILHRIPVAATSMESIKEFLPLAPDGSEGAVAVLVDEQTAGRGSGGRAWRSPVGNMHLTVAVRPPPLNTLYAVPFLVALGMHDALGETLRKVVPEAVVAEQLRLKWPNDVLWGSEKVAGAIVEMAETGELLIGMGVNCAEAPRLEDGGRVATCLQDIVSSRGATTDEAVCTAPDVAAACCAHLTRRLATATGDGPRPLSQRELIEEYGARLKMDIVLYERGVDGARGAPVKPLHLNTDGHLVVKCEDGSTKVLLADYLF